MRILIIGHARHGKDTVADFISELYGLKHTSSSAAAAKIFLYDALKDKYNYETPDDCFNDRVNRRSEWHDLICEYNKEDKARLAKSILNDADIYVGMRSNAELIECKRQGLFDLILGVFNPSMRLEPRNSFNIDIWKHCDVIIPNTGSLIDLKEKIKKLKL